MWPRASSGQEERETSSTQPAGPMLAASTRRDWISNRVPADEDLKGGRVMNVHLAYHGSLTHAGPVVYVLVPEEFDARGFKGVLKFEAVTDRGSKRELFASRFHLFPVRHKSDREECPVERVLIGTLLQNFTPPEGMEITACPKNPAWAGNDMWV